MFSTVFTGNLGQDPDFRYAANGEAYMRLQVAVSTGKDSQPLWVKVVAFGKTAEWLSQAGAKKGNRVTVMADSCPELETFQRKDGSWDSGLVVKASRVEVQTDLPPLRGK